MDDIDAELEADWNTVVSWAFSYRQALNDLNTQFGLQILPSGIYFGIGETSSFLAYEKILYADNSPVVLRVTLKGLGDNLKAELIAKIRKLATIARKELVP